MSFKKRIWSLGLSMMAIAVVAYAGMVWAQGSRSKESSSVTDKGVLRVTVEGELHAEIEGSETKSNRTDKYALRVRHAVDRGGEELTNMRGRSLHFLQNSKSEELIMKHSEGSKLIIKGKLHVEKALLEVESFNEASGSGPKGSDTKSPGSGSK